MFGPPKSRLAKPQPLSSGGSTRKTSTSSSNTMANGQNQRTSSSLSNSSTKSSSMGVQRQASQSSLLAAGRSTSKSSILSDTTASVCSTNNSNGNSNSKPAATTTTTTSSSGITRITTKSRPLSTTTTAIAAGNRPTTTLTIRAAATKSRPSSISSSASISSSTTSSSISSSASPANRRVPTLAMSLRDKDQQIKLLIKERDEQKFQAELMARKAAEFEEKFLQSEVERSHVTREADDEVVELRRLAQEFEDENKKLLERLAGSEQLVSDTQFKLDEMECERGELKRELEDCEQQLEALEHDRKEMAEGKPAIQISSERAISKAKYEREIEELKEQIQKRDETMMQLRNSLEMRKNEVSNLQAHAGDLERKLKIESERSERHLKRIDETNLELKAAEAKLSTKMEENEMYEKQVRQLRQELRAAEEKLEQVSLARKKDVDVLHNKLSAARRGATPTSPQPNFKTPTPQDELVRLQMEIRDLRDQLTDREAELDCNRRDLEVMRRKMETRTLEVDCNNQELARRCQDLLEQNRQSEDTVKQLLKSTTEHSAQLMRATEDLKEANGKCIKLREEIQELEGKLDEQLKLTSQLRRENSELRDENEEYEERIGAMRQQVDNLNEQLQTMCDQLHAQSNSLHKDRESLADQLSQCEIDLAQLRSDLANSRQDLRTTRLQTQEVANERDRLKGELEIKEKYVKSRNEVIETLRVELEDSKKSLGEYKQKIDELRQSAQQDVSELGKELRAQVSNLKRELQLRTDECNTLRNQWEIAEKSHEEEMAQSQQEKLNTYDSMRRKHSQETDQLKLKLKDLEDQLEEAKSSTLKRSTPTQDNSNSSNSNSNKSIGSQVTFSSETLDGNGRKSAEERSQQSASAQYYESQIEFLNSLVVDMQRKCDDYKHRLSQLDTMNIMKDFDNLILFNGPTKSAADKRSQADKIPQDDDSETSSQTGTLTRAARGNHNGINNNNNNNNNNNSIKRPVVHFNISNNTNIKSNKPQQRISGRPYCDICNIYDQHHTIYCPNVTEKLASRNHSQDLTNNNNNNNNNGYVNGIKKNNYSSDDIDFEDILRQSLESVPINQFASLRRPLIDRQSRPFCDHCELFGHTISGCLQI